jgi:hypothetical protein
MQRRTHRRRVGTGAVDAARVRRALGPDSLRMRVRPSAALGLAADILGRGGARRGVRDSRCALACRTQRKKTQKKGRLRRKGGAQGVNG